MDDRGFDDLVRRLPNASGTRRGALLGVLAALAGSVGVAEGRTRCAAGLRRCKAGTKKPCVDLATDPAHCGACGNACAVGETCAAGVCTGSCTPSCNGSQCGDDGCGGTCGQCGGGERCRGGRCLEPEDDGPITPGPDDQCIEANETCSSEGDTCCDPQRTCGFTRCAESPTCCGLDGARCEDNCDCCVPFFCGKGTCLRLEQG